MTAYDLLIKLMQLSPEELDLPIFVPSAAGKQAPEVVVFPDKVCL